MRSSWISSARRLGGYWLPFVLWICLLAVHLAVEGGVEPTARVLGAILGLPAVVGGYRYLRKRLFHRLPVPEYALLQAYVFWGMPTITGSLERAQPVSQAGLRLALLAALLFVATAILLVPLGQRAGAALARSLARALPARLPGTVRLFLPGWVAVTALASAGLTKLAPAALRYPLTIVSAGSGLLAYLVVRRSNTGRGKHLPELAAILLSLAGLSSGMMTAVLTPIVTLVALRFLVERKPPWRLLLAGMAVYVILNPAKHVFRETYWGEWDATRWEETAGTTIVTPDQALSGWWTGLKEAWGGGGKEKTDTSAIDRLNELTTIARTFEWAGGVVPWERGRGWALIPASVIPRLFYPDKPLYTEVFNDRFNVLFGFQTWESTYRTTNAFPVIADGYWNFGWLGVIFVGLIIGFYWGLISRLWHPGHWGMAWLGIFFLVHYRVTPFLFGQIAGFPQTVLGIAAALWGLVLLAGLVTVDAGSSGHTRLSSMAALRKPS